MGLRYAPFVPDLPPWFDLPHWFETHQEWVAVSAAVSLVMLVGSALGLPWIVARLPEDYFLRRRRDRIRASGHPLRGWAITIGRNALGVVLILAGAAMLVLPGQGLLTILAGILVADVPGKRRIALWVLRRPGVAAAVDWLRARAGRPALRLPPHGAPPPSGDGHPGSG